jgi:hypothetical protein
MPVVRTLLALLFLSSAAFADELRTLDNQTIVGKVVAVNAKEVSIKKMDGVIATVPLDNVIALDLQAVKGVPDGHAYTDIRLIDDSVVHSEGFVVKGNEIEITLLQTKEKLKIPLAYVQYILKGAHNSKLKTAFDKMLADKEKDKKKVDCVLYYRSEILDSVDGALGDADEKGQKIRFRPKGFDPLMVPLANIQGLIFYREEIGLGDPICMVYDTSGNVLAATKVAIEGKKVVMTTTLKGLTVQWDQASVARFDYNLGKLGFLSDMTPSKVVEKSAVGLIVTHRKDVNLDGDPIVLDRPYAKGLSLHAYTALEYDLKGKYKKFTAVLGVDTRVGSESEPKVTIEVDGRKMFDQTITTKMVVPVDLDITKASTLRITVTSANILDLHDHVTIAVPKVSK